MSINLDNRARPDKQIEGQQYFEWEVFVDAPSSALDRIDHVVYFLHPTFPNPVRTVSDRSSQFALRARGWGEFQINAKVVFEDDEVEQVEYQLDLSKSWDGG